MWDKMSSARALSACALTAAVLLFTSSSSASQWGRPWEQLAVTADFIGVVKRTASGNGISKFSVVDAWKRPPKDARTSLELVDWSERLTDPEQGDPPGEKFLVFGYRPAISGEWMYTSDGSQGRRWRLGEPYTDYLITVARKIPSGDTSPRISIGRRDTDLATFRKDVRNFLRQTPEFQELAILRAWSTDIRIDAYEVDEAENVRQFLDALMDYAAESSHSGRARRVIQNGGMSLTMAYLDGKRSKPIPFGILGVKQHIRRRLKIAPLRMGAAR
jgi:hypothetical protein